MSISTLPGPIEVAVPLHGLPIPRTMPESSSSSSAAVKRACDACHRRKVKCIGDGTRLCKNCASAGLTCTYNAVPQKKGPKGSRAKVIAELRDTQRRTQLTIKHLGIDIDSPPHSPSHRGRNGLLSIGLTTACVDYFFAHLYPTQPILHRQKVGETIGQMETSTEAYCLIVSLCAYMMIQPNMILPPGALDDLDVQPRSTIQLGHTLLREALRDRQSYDYIENPTVWSVITSFFLFSSYFCLDRQNTAWFHLREATTLALALEMHEEQSYQLGDVVESSRRRRLYWLLFTTERAYALQQHKPLSLQATINLPTLDEDPAESVELSGFIHLARLFRPFDDTFVGLWNKARVGCTTEWLTRLQQQLSDALPNYLQCTETQAVDLRCSQQWLRTMVWQLTISHGFLSSAASENALSFRFPIEVSRDLVQSAAQFSQQSMEVHGIGLIEKLFDVACTLTDVMSVIPQEQYFEFGARDYLNQLVTLISTLRGGQQRYLPLLMEKINETIPNAPGYTISAIPDGLRSEDVYDGSQSSNPNSGTSTPFDSTPFGSPLSAPDRPFAYNDMITSNGMQYSTVSAPIHYATYPAHTSHGLPIKYDSSG